MNTSIHMYEPQLSSIRLSDTSDHHWIQFEDGQVTLSLDNKGVHELAHRLQRHITDPKNRTKAEDFVANLLKNTNPDESPTTIFQWAEETLDVFLQFDTSFHSEAFWALRREAKAWDLCGECFSELEENNHTEEWYCPNCEAIGATI